MTGLSVSTTLGIVKIRTVAKGSCTIAAPKHGGTKIDLKSYIRDIPDFPTPGILFRDITPLLQTPAAFKYVVDRFVERYTDIPVDVIVAIEARGFLFGTPLAYALGKPMVPVRKEGKLPAETMGVGYSLEYGTNVVEMHKDGILPGQRVVIVDDLLATGGTLAAAVKLVEQAEGRVESLAMVIELTGLNGRDLLQGYDVFTLVQY